MHQFLLVEWRLIDSTPRICALLLRHKWWISQTLHTHTRTHTHTRVKGTRPHSLVTRLGMLELAFESPVGAGLDV